MWISSGIWHNFRITSDHCLITIYEYDHQILQSFLNRRCEGFAGTFQPMVSSVNRIRRYFASIKWISAKFDFTEAICLDVTFCRFFALTISLEIPFEFSAAENLCASADLIAESYITYFRFFNAHRFVSHSSYLDISRCSTPWRMPSRNINATCFHFKCLFCYLFDWLFIIIMIHIVCHSPCCCFPSCPFVALLQIYVCTIRLVCVCVRFVFNKMKIQLSNWNWHKIEPKWNATQDTESVRADEYAYHQIEHLQFISFVWILFIVKHSFV